MILRLLLAAASVVLHAAAAELTIKSPRIATVSKVGDLDNRQDLHADGPLRLPVELSGSDILRLSLQIVDKETGEGVQPHQVFLRFFDKATEEEGIIPLKVSTQGKVKFDLNLAKLPASFPPTSNGLLQTTLIVGSYVHTPAKFGLFNLKVPASPAPLEHPEQVFYKPLPEIHHTFRPDQKTPPKVVSAVFTLLVLSPWFGLVVALSRVPQKYPSLTSPSVMPFLVLLGAMEWLIYTYWVRLKLPDVLLYGSVLGLVTIAAGRHALGSLGSKQ